MCRVGICADAGVRACVHASRVNPACRQPQADPILQVVGDTGRVWRRRVCEQCVCTPASREGVHQVAVRHEDQVKAESVHVVAPISGSITKVGVFAARRLLQWTQMELGTLLRRPTC